jgi:hypothetical protein
MEKADCEYCDKEFDYDPGYCCFAFDCGCQGRPTNPQVCSNECWDKLLKRMDGN